jgi:putative biopolymer transport protein exbD
MALKRKTKVTDSFSMASMTDVIFLLLIFFLVTSTIVAPNVIKVSLPSAAASTADSQQNSARIVIDTEGNYYLGLDKAAESLTTPELLEQQLGMYAAEHPDAYVAIHADENVPYSAVVKGINIASKLNLKVVLATKIEAN